MKHPKKAGAVKKIHKERKNRKIGLLEAAIIGARTPTMGGNRVGEKDWVYE